jgi:D-alanyl-D-alanine carboxypeptidase
MKPTCRRRSSALAVAVFLFGPSTTAQDISAALDSIASTSQDSRRLPGVSVSVQLGDKLLLAKGYGEADVENHVPATAETVYQIGSITRAFTAASVLKLVSQGQLRLDDRVASRLPMFSLKEQGVTIGHLLTHTSGIPNYSDIIGPRDRAVDLSPQEVVARFADKPLDFMPGDAQRRSASNYFLLGLVIEQVTGMAYGQYVEREFRAVGLHDTVYCDSRRLIERRARGYERGANGVENARHIEMNATFAAGALCSTVGDLVKWVRALMSGAVIPQDQVRQMTTPVRIKGQMQQYGAGIAVDQLDGHSRIHHEGALDGFAGELAHYPEFDLTIAVLANVVPAGRQNRDVDVEFIAQELARAVFKWHR